MADLSAGADPGSGHLLGPVPGDGQAASMAPYHVGTLSVYLVAALRPVSAVSLSGTVQLTLLTAAMAVTYSDRPENDSVFYFHI